MRAIRVIGLVLAFALWLAIGWLGTGCSAVESIEPGSDTSACERAKPTNAECAIVYAFAEPADNELGHVELCVREQDLEAAQRQHGIAWPSTDDRFKPYAIVGVDPPCFWCCAADCGPGANAYNGSFCLGGAS